MARLMIPATMPSIQAGDKGMRCTREATGVLDRLGVRRVVGMAAGASGGRRSNYSAGVVAIAGVDFASGRGQCGHQCASVRIAEADECRCLAESGRVAGGRGRDAMLA
jgi:hypothetical protein